MKRFSQISKHLNIYFILVVFTFCLSNHLKAQQEFGLHNMPNLWQSSKTNPAFMQQNEETIGLLGFGSTLFFDGPTYREFTSKQGDSLIVIDADKAILNMADHNAIRQDFEIETFTYTQRTGDWQFSLGHSIKSNAFVRYSKTIPQTVWQGNAQFIGQTVPLVADVLLQKYHEIGLGIAHRLNEHIGIGLRLKYLNGITSTYTSPGRNTINLKTLESYYQIEMTNDYQINAANASRFDTLDQISLGFSPTDLTVKNFLTKNIGYGLDIGVQANFGQWNFAASLLDFGRNNWTDDNYNYTTKGDIAYNGLDISAALTGDSLELVDVIDTLNQILNVEVTENDFHTSLPTRVYLSVNYQASDNWNIHANYFYQRYEKETFSGFAIGANTQLLGKLNIGATYTGLIQQNEWANLGLHANITFGKFQFFALSDDIISLLSLETGHYFMGRVGINYLMK